MEHDRRSSTPNQRRRRRSRSRSDPRRSSIASADQPAAPPPPARRYQHRLLLSPTETLDDVWTSKKMAALQRDQSEEFRARRQWPNGIVPVLVDSRTFSRKETASIHRAAERIEKRVGSCRVRFRFIDEAASADDSYLRIVNSTRAVPHTVQSAVAEQRRQWETCGVAHIGMSPNGGAHYLVLTEGCFRQNGVIQHELLHVLGLAHEHQRRDRDRYVDIDYAAITPGHEGNFVKLIIRDRVWRDLEYDYGSIMHYNATAFSKDSRRTIVALRPLPDNIRMGQRNRLSNGDVDKLNNLYPCLRRDSSHSCGDFSSHDSD